MNYNWISACTAEGRERLKELLDKGENVPMRMDTPDGCSYYYAHSFSICYFRLKERFDVYHREYDKTDLSGIEFLDPEPSNTYTNPEIAALKAENERMRNALLEIEADARAKLAANLPLNSNETMHSVKHGLGRLLENGKSGDIGAVIDAIARTFKGNDDSGA